jgi:hypothetical protein
MVAEPLFTAEEEEWFDFVEAACGPGRPLPTGPELKRLFSPPESLFRPISADRAHHRSRSQD